MAGYDPAMDLSAWTRVFVPFGNDEQTRADLLSQWAQMDASGIDPLRTMQTLRVSARGSAQAALDHVIDGLGQGMSPASSWVDAGLLQEGHGELLEAGFASGRGEWALRTLANNLTERAARWRRFQSRMVFPVAVLLLAGFLSALPPLVANEIGFLGFLIRLALPSALLIGVIAGGIRLLQAAEENQPARLIPELPLIGPWLRRRTRADFLAMTAQSLKAGIPARQAVTLAASAIRPVGLGQQYARIAGFIDGGLPVAEAMLKGQALDATGFSLVNSGEHGGALDDMLERVAAMEDRSANESADQMALWIPRIIYIAIAGLMLVSVLSFWSAYSPGA